MSSLTTSIESKLSAATVSKGESDVIRRVLHALEGLDYGSVEITVHDGKIVQIDRRQRSRFTQPLPVPSSRS